MKNQNKNFIKCDFCDFGAIDNFQKVWKKFTIDKKGEYKEDRKFNGGDFEEPTGGDNVHLCEKHLKKWMEGRI
ncbi:MAG: hypothetical protein AAB913_00430 [Patescibacteria group bacterium]